MSETSTTSGTDEQGSSAPAAPRRRGGGLSGKVLAELQQIAAELGIPGTAKMRKGPLIEAIKQAQSGGAPAGSDAAAGRDESGGANGTAAATLPGTGPDDAPAAPRADRADRATSETAASDEQPARQARRDGARDAAAPAETPRQETSREETSRGSSDGERQQGRQGNRQDDQQGRQDNGQDEQQDDRQQSRQNDRQGNRRDEQQGDRQQSRQNNRQGNRRDEQQDDRQQGRQNNRQNDQGDDQDDDEGGGRRRNRNRNRNRNRSRDRGSDGDPMVTEDDVLIPAAGILDVLDNYAFVRTSGYLPGPSDVYVSMSMVRKWGLRRGDAIVGQVRQIREGERKEKFNPLVTIESVNGQGLDEASKRVEFSKLTPLYPSERLRLETDPSELTGRIIDLVAPLGKGQRGLIVSPPKAGKTMVMQRIANAISANNPECHLMIVLVDERPEEVTDFQRTVDGEVIASTFDRPASDHTTVAELAIERAKRLVELGHDVVVLLDGITRLGRAYNLAAPASGRILSGGVDSAALYPPKKFFGAARNIEDGGSLTIIATALVETGSRMDEVIFEEFKGTGNSELRLRRELADKRLFPAIDAVASGTRREEQLLGREELAVVWKLRRLLSGLEGQQGLELLVERLRKSGSNAEFLMQVQKTTPGEE